MIVPQKMGTIHRSSDCSEKSTEKVKLTIIHLVK